MEPPGVVVVGSGISGAAFARRAAERGHRVRVIERSPRVGGALASIHTDSGFWYELGAHTCYNSYGALIELLEECGLLENLVPRGKSVLRFLHGDRVAPGKNLGLLLRELRLLDVVRHLPRWFRAAPPNATVRERFARFVGERNYEAVLKPLLCAVPSQDVDEFPGDLLFKKRERRQDVLRSFTYDGGLGRLVEDLLDHESVEVRTGCGALALHERSGGFELELEDGTRAEAPVVALALPPRRAGELLPPGREGLATLLAEVDEVAVDSHGFALPADASPLPYATFFIPRADTFHSVVTRDVVPDESRRAFTFHFRPGLDRAERVQRMEAVVGVDESAFEDSTERRATLPALRRGHAERVAAVDAALADAGLALTGNWFGGLSIEDCVLRSEAEWRRVERFAGG